MNVLPDSSRAFLIFFKVFLVMAFSADPQKINTFIFVGFVDLIFSLFYLIILCFDHFLVQFVSHTDFLVPLATHGFRARFCSFLTHCLTEACLSSILSMRHRRVSNPTLMSLFFVGKVNFVNVISEIFFIEILKTSI